MSGRLTVEIFGFLSGTTEGPVAIGALVLIALALILGRLAAIERRKAVAENHPRCQITRRNRGHRSLATEHHLIDPSRKFPQSSRGSDELS